MISLTRIRSAWHALRHGAQLEGGIDEELSFHLEQQTKEHLAEGMPPEEARRRALAAFGGVQQVREECREAWLTRLLETTVQDARYALRGISLNPLFAATVIVTLAIGIGGTTAVFSVVDRILFRSLPYAEPERLVSFGYIAPIEPNEFYLGADYMDLRKLDGPFAAVTSWSGVQPCDLTEQNPARLACARVEANFLATLGVVPLLGRDFSREEDRPQSPKTALLGYHLWRSRFGGDPHIVGRTVQMDGVPARIVGVLPRAFELPTLAQADLLVPQALDESRQRHPNTGAVLRVFARLRPGVSAAQARAQLEPLFEQELQYVPPAFRHEVQLSVRSLRDRQTADSRRAAWILLAAVLAVLLIACANIANLLMARATARRQELAVRAALGAGRGRLIRQALTESLLLAMLGALAGCALAMALLRGFMHIAPQGIPRLSQAALDGRVLGFTLAVSVAAGLAFGMAAALHAPSAEALTSSRALGGGPMRLRQLLAGAQIAASIVLLAGAGLLLRSLWKLEAVPLGVRADHVVTAEIVLGQSRYAQPAQQVAFFEQLEARLRAIPGVEQMALSDSLPPAGMAHSKPYAALEVSGRPKYAEGTGGMVVWRSVTPEYFAALGVPIRRGRAFSERDRDAGEHPLILSETLARRMFGNEDPLGQRIRFDYRQTQHWYTVVGVAADVKNGGVAVAPDPEYYVVRQHTPGDSWDHSTVMVRTPLEPGTVAGWIRSAVAELDPTLPITVETMDQRVRKLEQRPRFDAFLLALFAGLALLLAAVGIYGVIAFLVTQRTQEIGVRMALGATTRDILRLVAGKGLALIAISTGAGAVAALAASRLLESMLFGVGTRDAVTYLSAAALVMVVGTAATLLPARAAAKVDPMVALRHE